MCVNRLDADKFMKLDFTTNFGIESGVRKMFTDALQTDLTYEQQAAMFAKVPMQQLLLLHVYLNWADKKLHSVFFIEGKD